MKPDLQRIEAALNQLKRQEGILDDALTEFQSVDSSAAQTSTSLSSISFQMRSPHRSRNHPNFYSHESDWPLTEPQTTPTQDVALDPQRYLHMKPNQTSCPALQTNQAPTLPELAMSDFEAASPDPGFVLQLIRKFEAVVGAWYAELQRILQRIHALEAEGPAINGWLESRPLEINTPSASTLRHADVEELLVYVDQLCNLSEQTISSQYSYFLCGHHADGQVWSRPCRAEELSDVSMAIARYQILSQLRDRQECLEKRLSAIATQLTQIYQTYVG